MNKAPYTIVKHYRGKYQVLDANGLSLSNGYVSANRARMIVSEHKLQDKCLSNQRLLVQAESVCELKADALHRWLWEVLIRFSVEEMKMINKKPRLFKSVYDAWMDRVSKRINNNKDDSCSTPHIYR